MFAKNKAPPLLISIVIIFSLFAALNPASDIDLDGNLDSLITEGFLLVPLIFSMVGLFSLLSVLPVAGVFAVQGFSCIVIHPPISN